MRLAGPADAREIARQNHLYFDIPLLADDAPAVAASPDSGDRSTYMAVVNGQVVGKVHTHLHDGEGWISGLGVLPEHRRRGYGRAMLRLAVASLAAQRPGTIALEVATENDGALSLYRSCGFEVVTGYDYYAVATGASVADLGQA